MIANQVSDYTYTGLGDGTDTTQYLQDIVSPLAMTLAEYGPGGAEDDIYTLLGLDIIGQQQDGAWSYFGYDGLGSVRQVYDGLGQLDSRPVMPPMARPSSPTAI